jgi:HlyD family secretion protein
MKTLFRWLIILGILGGASAAAYQPAAEYWRKRNQTQWRTADVVRGQIVAVVNATGTVKPVRSLTVGAFVSGPIDPEVPIAHFNQEVAANELLCKIDLRIYDANLKRDQASLDSRIADLDRAKAQLRQAERDLERANKLREEDPTFISQAEMDKFYFTVLTLRAQAGVAEKSVAVAQSQVDFSLTQLRYCEIRAPEAGIIINRKIDPGQMLAAQFQAPELFVIAPNFRERVDIHASVDEADIGLIRRALEGQRRVTFTVDAYQDELFTGKIEEVRMNSTTTQNVVTYPVIVATANPDLKLLPGMTASLSFEVDSRDDVVKLPNAALRFFPNSKQVRPEDRHLVEGLEQNNEEDAAQSERALSADERSKLRKQRNRRHVWVVEGQFLRAVEVMTGLSDSQFTEMIEGSFQPGDRLVTGVTQPSAFGAPR